MPAFLNSLDVEITLNKWFRALFDDYTPPANHYMVLAGATSAQQFGSTVFYDEPVGGGYARKIIPTSSLKINQSGFFVPRQTWTVSGADWDRMPSHGFLTDNGPGVAWVDLDYMVQFDFGSFPAQYRLVGDSLELEFALQWQHPTDTDSFSPIFAPAIPDSINWSLLSDIVTGVTAGVATWYLGLANAAGEIVNPFSPDNGYARKPIVFADPLVDAAALISSGTNQWRFGDVTWNVLVPWPATPDRLFLSPNHPSTPFADIEKLLEWTIDPFDGAFTAGDELRVLPMLVLAGQWGADPQ